MLFKKHGCSLTRSLAVLINLKLSIIDIRSQKERKKVVNDPLPFLFLRLPTSSFLMSLLIWLNLIIIAGSVQEKKVASEI